MNEPVTATSLRSRLMWPIALALLLAGLLQAGFAYRAALSQADESFDEQMRQLAMVLRLGTDAGRLTALELLDYSVQVLGDDGRVLYQSSRRRLVPSPGVPGYSVVRESDSQYRVYALRDRDQWVRVVEAALRDEPQQPGVAFGEGGAGQGSGHAAARTGQ